VLVTIRTGKPILCLPFFGDVHSNAGMFTGAKAGLYLHKVSQSETAMRQKVQQYFARSRLTAQDVTQKGTLLIDENREYQRWMRRRSDRDVTLLTYGVTLLKTRDDGDPSLFPVFFSGLDTMFCQSLADCW
jgi:hypothetical protein